jgi:TPR repeat protein
MRLNPLQLRIIASIGMMVLGIIGASGDPISTPPEPDKLAKLIDRAAANDPEALANLGGFYAFTDSPLRDVPKGIALLKRGMQLGSATATAYYGELFLDGTGVAADVDEGLSFIEVAAEHGSASAAYELGVFYALGKHVRKNAGEMLRWYTRAAELGDPEAQNDLGWSLMFGMHGAPVDIERGLRWIKEAARQGEVHGQTTLGDCYEKGRGVPRDYVQARYWYAEAAERNFPIALLALGEFSEKGWGVPADLAAARGFYRRAADLGEERAAIRLKALKGDRRAQSQLGDLLYDGSGPSGQDFDREEALVWFERAARQGDVHARERLRQLGH